jgi:hypothetical protein
LLGNIPGPLSVRSRIISQRWAALTPEEKMQFSIEEPVLYSDLQRKKAIKQAFMKMLEIMNYLEMELKMEGTM